MIGDNDPVLQELKALRRDVNGLCLSVIAIAIGVMLLTLRVILSIVIMLLTLFG